MSLLDHQTISTSPEGNEGISKKFQEKVTADKVRQFKAVSEYNIRVVTIEQSRLIGRFVQKLKRSETIVKQHNKIKANLLKKYGAKSELEYEKYIDKNDNKLSIKQNDIQNEAEINIKEMELETVKKRPVHGIRRTCKGTEEKFDEKITALLIGKETSLPNINNINKVVEQRANEQEKISQVSHDERIKTAILRHQKKCITISRDKQIKSPISHDQRMISVSRGEGIKSKNLGTKSIISKLRDERIKIQTLRDKSKIFSKPCDEIKLNTFSQLNIEHYKSMYVSMKKRVSLQESKKIYLSQPFKH